MQEKRPVPLNLLFSIFKTKNPFSGIGLVFIILPITVFIPLIAFFSSFKEAYEKYDYNKIINQGKSSTAKVTLVTIQKNVTIDKVHPQIIEYAYNNNGWSKDDKFKTLGNANNPVFNIGDSISIKIFNGESVIEGLKPFTFPIHFFYMPAFFFLLFGISFFLIGFLPVLKHYRLYKTGIRKEATIISFYTTYVIPVVTMNQNVLVNYFYLGQNGNKIFDESISPGLELLTEKKEQDKIDIFVSPKNETISCIVPKSLL